MSRALVDNAGDPNQVRGAQRKEKDAANLERDDMRAVLAIPAGRRTIWRLLEACGVSRNAFDRDPYYMAFRTGEQNVGIRLTAMIETANPTALVEMMAEAATERNRSNASQ